MIRFFGGWDKVNIKLRLGLNDMKRLVNEKMWISDYNDELNIYRVSIDTKEVPF
jgi:hypothetical protein